MPESKKTPRGGRAWTEEEERLLGTMTDAKLAAKLGRSPSAVTMKRLDQGIAPSRPRSRRWSEQELALLGKMTDAKLAARMGVSRKHVLQKRRTLGRRAFSAKNSPRSAK